MSASNVHMVNVKVVNDGDEEEGSPEKRANSFLDDDDEDDNTSNLLRADSPQQAPNTDYLMDDIPAREAFFAILLGFHLTTFLSFCMAFHIFLGGRVVDDVTGICFTSGTWSGRWSFGAILNCTHTGLYFHGNRGMLRWQGIVRVCAV